jgi:SHS2 domain-containing protein
MNGQAFEEIEHTADWALRVRGENLTKLLHNAALGMLQIADIEPGPGPSQENVITINAADRESLLVTWLEELLFNIETRGITYTSFDLQLDGYTKLVARVSEAPIGKIRREIKAVTYHDLEIRQTVAGLEVTLVFDV